MGFYDDEGDDDCIKVLVIQLWLAESFGKFGKAEVAGVMIL